MKTKQDLITAINGGAELSFQYFWGVTNFDKQPAPLGCFNLWSPHQIADGMFIYHCGEQAMMVTKALLFGDKDTADELMKITRPIDLKAKITGMDKKVWKEKLFDVLVGINMHKFSQHHDIRKVLLDTGDDVLVAASTYDVVLGIGTHTERAKTLKVEEWEGENVLGFALMETRNNLNTIKQMIALADPSGTE